MELIKDYIDLAVDDETTMQAYIVRPADQVKRPAILVLQEAFGVNAHIRNVTDRIAAEGYTAIAPELFHRTASKGFEGSYTDFSGVREHIQALSKEGIKADLKAAYAYLTSVNQVLPDQVATIGFCMGGRVSFIAAETLPLRAAACFYGSGIEALLEDIEHISCPLLFCWGGLDQHITKDKMDQTTNALTEKGKDFINVVFSKADHGFFCDARAAYHPQSAAAAWALVKTFWKVNW